MSRLPLTEKQVLGLLVVTVVLLGVGKRLWPDVVPISAMTIPVIVAGWRLSRRSVLVLNATVGVALLVDLAASPFARTWIAAGVVVVVCLLAFRYASLREQWGLDPTVGVPLLLQIRDRVRAQGEPPALPSGWVMARALRSAGDAGMRGDFTLVQRVGTMLQMVVVDVSGHGVDVGPRAVQIAGAFGGLMQVLPPDELMARCNEYVLCQGWERDYATAVHSSADLATGDVVVRAGGHPPPRVRRVDGSWVDVAVSGPLLGLVPDAAFVPVTVGLDPGDMLVMVTDGALDDPSDDPWSGVVDLVDQWMALGLPPGSHVFGSSRGLADDDQTVVVLHREATSL